MFELKQCSVKEVLHIFKHFDKRFELKESYAIYVLFEDGTAVSCLSVGFEGRNYAKIHASYTPAELRRNGYFTTLLSKVLKLYPDKTIKADCLPDSFGAFLKCGFDFIEKKRCKNYTLYRTIKRVNDNGSSAEGN